ncbi:BadF/BadG/BcrA/BcrD ATPase family protein [Pelagibacterium luteolum]|uniref:Glucosamine kinase n=1 Tax=Pelagibacterium luteolum TaxID=440168 RepID=A0A1G7VK54_9HYPH|nr:BadF/BadG/BcrA/BcrD ATPase family protein [Pelagibacterium luteolum]SDG60134.1 glucosamine kinase [Pelagibacterium luteolum]
MPKYFLGVDGGGTNCRIRLADANLRTLAEARGGRSNLQLEGGDPAYFSIQEGTRQVFAMAGLDFAATTQTQACFGMAGARLPSAREAFALRDWPFEKVTVYDDIDIARAGAHEGEDGAVIIVGTGSAGMALVDGQRFQVGGWGFHIGDQMSGAILGRELVRYAVEADDGLVPTSPLTKAVIKQLGGDVNTVMAWSFDKRQPADYGALMPLFMDYFDKGDPVALDLMEIELGFIDRYVSYFKSCGANRLAVVGGFGQRLLPLLEIRYGDYVCMPRAEPLHGAVILACQNAATADIS